MDGFISHDKSLRFCSKNNGKLSKILNYAVISGFLFTRITQSIIKRREFGARGKWTQRNHFGVRSFNLFERYMSLKAEGSLSYLVLCCSVSFDLFITYSSSTITRPGQEGSLCSGLVV